MDRRTLPGGFSYIEFRPLLILSDKSDIFVAKFRLNQGYRDKALRWG